MEKKARYKSKEELKKKISIAIYESVLDGVKERMFPGQKLSPLIENLLIGWCYEAEKMKKVKGLKLQLTKEERDKILRTMKRGGKDLN